MIKFIKFTVLFTLCLFPVIVSPECRIDPLKIKPTPLIIDSQNEVLYPDSQSSGISLFTGEKITIACPGSQLLEQSILLAEHITATCVENNLLSSAGRKLNFYSLRCQRIPQNTIRFTRNVCAEGGKEIEIGYLISENQTFVRQIRVCFDDISLTPLYSQYVLTSKINYRHSRVPRIFFNEDGFYSMDLVALYSRNVERRTINTLLGLDSTFDTYIKGHGDDRFINRGHLAAQGDFVYDFQQLATFHYVNSAPQWASINGGNWNELEISLRQLANSSNTDFDVYTGVYGVSTLRHSKTNEKTNLYLHTANNRNLMPIPQLFWKLIQSRTDGRSIVIVSINNVYEVDNFRDFVCKDVSDNVSWFNEKLRRQKRNRVLGYMYACSVTEFCERINLCSVVNRRSLLL
ncbi:uncharacterized protein [Euwallacea fornicatus]|uniref:uncharacterized protein n=1 Tax=Euwallacea fornicatus TaxID=995702 RepID=UPI00338FB2CE